MSVKVMKVIVTDLELRGQGTEESPMRRVTQYWGFDGKLLAEVDHYQERTEDQKAVEDMGRVIEAQKKALEALRAEIAEARLVFEKGEMGEVMKQEEVKTVVGRQMRTLMQGYWTVKKEKVELEEKLAAYEFAGAAGEKKKARTLRLRSGQAERKKKGRG